MLSVLNGNKWQLLEERRVLKRKENILRRVWIDAHLLALILFMLQHQVSMYSIGLDEVFFFVRAHSVTASRSGWTTSPDTGKAKWSPSFFPLLTKPALIKIKSSCQGVGVTINTLSNCYQWHRKISCYVTDFSKQMYLTRNMIEPILKPHVFSLCMQWKHKTTADDDVVHHNI